ncbi:thiamine pyrophosphate-binding protein [Streptomyces sp. NPDC021224]|uniref:thiamine pyrophosphate-binding protein n=1 Tax=unclassified Streptomyces TaxID=2593676 RepID=UPI0037B59E6E
MSGRAAAWDMLLELLTAGGDRLVCGVPGDTPDLLDAADAAGGSVLTTRDQRTAVFAAVGWSRVRRRTAVVLLHAGPGYLTALPAVSEASSLRQPLLVLVVDAPEEGVGRGGFQELDPMDFRGGLYAWSHRVRSPAELGWAVTRALRTAEGPVGGPVLVALSRTALDGLPAERSGWARECRALAADPPPAPAAPSASGVREAAAVLRGARRPVVLLGGGARDTLGDGLATGLAARLGARVLVTASGRGGYPESRPEFAGVAGLYASRDGLRALGGADVILALGTALEETARTGWTPAEGARLVHVDHDPRVPGRAVPALGLVGDVRETALLLLDALPASGGDRPPPGAGRGPAPAPGARGTVTAPFFWRALEEALRGLDRPVVLTQENGLCDLWGYHVPVFRRPDHVTCVVPGEQTVMGFGFGAAAGVALAGQPAVGVGGDVAMECALSSMLVAADRALDVLYVVLRNRSFGWPSLSRAGGRTTAFDGGRAYPELFAAAGAHARAVTSAASLAPALDALLRLGGTRLLEVGITGRHVVPGAAEHGS